jgi:RNA polymerase sigma-70 factor (ECF subfamily)
VSQSSEVIDVGDRTLVGERLPTERSSAFRRLADNHLDRAYRLARAILRNPSDAQDATHDAFVQAWRKWSTLQDVTVFEHWFDRILVNTCRNRLRYVAQREARDISAELSLASADAYGAALDRDLIGRAISSLSPDHRIVVALRYFADLPIEEIATRLEIPPGTVQSRLHYALKRLHDSIDGADAKGTTR